jgi:hypothetical protein
MSLRNAARYAAMMGYSEPIPTDGPCIYCGALDGVVDGGGWRPDLDGQRCADRAACYERRKNQEASAAHFGSPPPAQLPSGSLVPAECDARARYVVALHSEPVDVDWNEAPGGLQAAAFPEFAPTDPKTGRAKPEQLALL